MRLLAALALAAATLALAACGGGEDAKLLPGRTAAEITENLESVEQLAAEGECIGAANAAEGVGTQVEALEGVDQKLKTALEQGADRLNQVVTTCEEEEAETIAPAEEATTTEEPAKLPPGQEQKAEKEREKEEKRLEKEAEKQEKSEPPPSEEIPEEPPAPPTPPSEGGGTGAPGGVSPGTPVEEGNE